jgi:SPW repeat
LKRLMWSNLVLGLWLMISPLVLVLFDARVYRVLWEDFLLGFGIVAFSLCRLVSRTNEEIALSDWLMTAAGVLTLINPLLYSYYNVKVGAWNNLAVGAVVFLLALYQDWRDSSMWHDHHRSAY